MSARGCKKRTDERSLNKRRRWLNCPKSCGRGWLSKHPPAVPITRMRICWRHSRRTRSWSGSARRCRLISPNVRTAGDLWRWRSRRSPRWSRLRSAQPLWESVVGSRNGDGQAWPRRPVASSPSPCSTRFSRLNRRRSKRRSSWPRLQWPLRRRPAWRLCFASKSQAPGKLRLSGLSRPNRFYPVRACWRFRNSCHRQHLIQAAPQRLPSGQSSLQPRQRLPRRYRRPRLRRRHSDPSRPKLSKLRRVWQHYKLFGRVRADLPRGWCLALRWSPHAPNPRFPARLSSGASMRRQQRLRICVAWSSVPWTPARHGKWCR